MDETPLPWDLRGDEDWQAAARQVWDALTALETEQGQTILETSCTPWVRRGYSHLGLLAADNPLAVSSALTHLNLALDAIVGCFYTARQSRGGWVQDLLSARDGVAQLAALLGPA